MTEVGRENVKKKVIYSQGRRKYCLLRRKLASIRGAAGFFLSFISGKAMYVCQTF